MYDGQLDLHFHKACKLQLDWLFHNSLFAWSNSLKNFLKKQQSDGEK